MAVRCDVLRHGLRVSSYLGSNKQVWRILGKALIRAISLRRVYTEWPSRRAAAISPAVFALPSN